MAQLLPQERRFYPQYIAMVSLHHKSFERQVGSLHQQQMTANRDSDDEGEDKGKAIKKEKAKEKAAGKDKEDDSTNEESNAIEGESIVIQFVEFLLSLLKVVRRNMRHSAQYFNLLYDFALLSIEEKKYLLARHVVREYTDFYMQTGQFAPASSRRGNNVRVLEQPSELGLGCL